MYVSVEMVVMYLVAEVAEVACKNAREMFLGTTRGAPGAVQVTSKEPRLRRTPMAHLGSR